VGGCVPQAATQIAATETSSARWRVARRGRDAGRYELPCLYDVRVL